MEIMWECVGICGKTLEICGENMGRYKIQVVWFKYYEKVFGKVGKIGEAYNNHGSTNSTFNFSTSPYSPEVC